MDRLQRMQQELIGTYDELKNAKARLAEKLLSAQTRLSHLEQARLGTDAGSTGADSLGASEKSLADVKVPVAAVTPPVVQLLDREEISAELKAECIEAEVKLSTADVELPCPAPLEVRNGELKDQTVVVANSQETVELRAQLDLRDQRIKQLEAALRDATLMRSQLEAAELACDPGRADELSSTLPIDDLSETVTLPTVLTPPLPLLEAYSPDAPEEDITREGSTDGQAASQEIPELPSAELQPAPSEDQLADVGGTVVLGASAAMPPGPPPVSPERGASQLEPTASLECSPADWPHAPAPPVQLELASAGQSESSLCPTETSAAMPTTVIVQAPCQHFTISTAERVQELAVENTVADSSSATGGVLVLPVRDGPLREVAATDEASVEAPTHSAEAPSICPSDAVESRTLSPTPRRIGSDPPQRQPSTGNAGDGTRPAEETGLGVTETTMATDMDAEQVAEFKTVEVRPSDTSGLVSIADPTNGRTILVRVGEGVQSGCIATRNANGTGSITCSAESPVGPWQTPAASPPPLARANSPTSMSPPRTNVMSAQVMNGTQVGKTQAGSGEISVTSASEDDDALLQGAARREAREVRRDQSWSSSRSEVAKSLTSPQAMGSNFTFPTSSSATSISGSQIGTPLSLRYRPEAANTRHQSFVIVRPGAQDGEQLENVALSCEARLRKRSPVVSPSQSTGRRQLTPAPATTPAPGSAAAAVGAAAGAAAAAVAALGAARSGDSVDVQQERARLLAAITGLRSAAEAAAHRAESAESRLAEEVFAAVLKVENHVQSAPLSANGDLAQGGMSDLEVTHRLGSAVGSAIIKDNPNQELASTEEGPSGCGSEDAEKTRAAAGVTNTSQTRVLGPIMNDIENAVARAVREREQIVGCVQRQYEELEEMVIKATSVPPSVKPPAPTPMSAGSTPAAVSATNVPVTSSAATGPAALLVQARPRLVAAPAPGPLSAVTAAAVAPTASAAAAGLAPVQQGVLVQEQTLQQGVIVQDASIATQARPRLVAAPALGQVPSVMAAAVAPTESTTAAGPAPVLVQAAVTPPVTIAPRVTAAPGAASPWTPVAAATGSMQLAVAQVSAQLPGIPRQRSASPIRLVQVGSIQAPLLRESSLERPVVDRMTTHSYMKVDETRSRLAKKDEARETSPLAPIVREVRVFSPAARRRSPSRGRSVSPQPAARIQPASVLLSLGHTRTVSPPRGAAPPPVRGMSHPTPAILRASSASLPVAGVPKQLSAVPAVCLSPSVPSSIAPSRGSSHTLPAAQPGGSNTLPRAQQPVAGQSHNAPPAPQPAAAIRLASPATSEADSQAGNSALGPSSASSSSRIALSGLRTTGGRGNSVRSFEPPPRVSRAQIMRLSSQELNGVGAGGYMGLHGLGGRSSACSSNSASRQPTPGRQELEANDVSVRRSLPTVNGIPEVTATQRLKSVTNAAGTQIIAPARTPPAAIQLTAPPRTPPPALTPPASRIHGSVPLATSTVDGQS